jgi:ubiquinone/menaquinone biosynthesis C-methylase UbiE
MDINEFFLLGMKREIPQLKDFSNPSRTGVCLNLGGGKQNITGYVNLDFPEWNADFDGLPFDDGTIKHIIAFHFLEHLSSARVIATLRECERVLMTGGTLNIVVPHRLSQMAYHDLDHKTFFCEETWRTLFSTPYYDKNREYEWKFEIGTNIIIGVVERNLALITQLVKYD